ncbi:S-layer homology domain-containing protein [Bacillus piscicola]|uniref:S-layer homology domain-containing protein n=1 Tax=Bacillus piscicola TaxID=1632684 RepID=UPI001F096F62|nr:S-layer homology domain-containing protein [Bacillus piscicola]
MRGKKVISAGLLAAGIFTTIPAGAEPGFTDVSKGFWADEAIFYLSEQGIISGYPDGAFRPNQSITRHQVAGMIAKALDLDLGNRPNPGFTDVNTNSTNYRSIAAVADEGIIRGSNGAFRPGETVTRGQMAAILARAFDLDRVRGQYFTDIDPSHWAYSDIGTVAAAGVAGGYEEDGTFRASNPTTRAQFSTFLTRALDERKRVEEPATAPTEKGAFVTEGDWLYTVDDDALIRKHLDSGEIETILTRRDIAGDYEATDIDGNNEFAGDGFKPGSAVHVKDDWVYYYIEDLTNGITNFPNSVWYRVKTDGTHKEYIGGGPNPKIIGNHLYYGEPQDFEGNVRSVALQQAKLDGSGEESIKTFKTVLAPAYSRYRGEWYLFDYLGRALINYNGNTVTASDVQSEKTETLYKGEVKDLFVLGENLYLYTGDKLIRMKGDGSNQETIRKAERLKRTPAQDGMYVEVQNNGQEELLLIHSNKHIESIFTGDKVTNLSVRHDGITAVSQKNNRTVVQKTVDGSYTEIEVGGPLRRVAHIYETETGIYILGEDEDFNDHLYYVDPSLNEAAEVMSRPHISVRVIDEKLYGTTTAANEKEGSVLFEIDQNNVKESERYTGDVSIKAYEQNNVYFESADMLKKWDTTTGRVTTFASYDKEETDYHRLIAAAATNDKVYTLLSYGLGGGYEKVGYELFVYDQNGEELDRVYFTTEAHLYYEAKVMDNTFYFFINKEDFIGEEPAVTIDLETLEVSF